MILKSIEKEHVLAGLKELDRIGEENWNPSTGYDLLFEGKRYPPKEVIRQAGLLATGEEPVYFGGGKDSNNVLIKLGFTIVLKGTHEAIGLNHGVNKKVNDVKVTPSPALVEEQRTLDKLMDTEGLSETEKERLVKTRIGQGVFRDRLLSKFSKCALCGVTDRRILIASHIKLFVAL